MAMNSSNKATVKRHNISSFSNIPHQIGGTLKQTANKAEKYGGLFSKDAKPEFYTDKDFIALEEENYTKFSEMFFKLPVGELEDTAEKKTQVSVFKNLKAIYDKIKNNTLTETETSTLNIDSDEIKRRIVKRLALFVHGLALNIKGLGADASENSRIIRYLPQKGYNDFLLSYTHDLINTIFAEGSPQLSQLTQILKITANKASIFYHTTESGFGNKTYLEKLYEAFLKSGININLFFILFEESKPDTGVEKLEKDTIKNFSIMKQSGIKELKPEKLAEKTDILHFFFGTTTVEPIKETFKEQKVSKCTEEAKQGFLLNLLAGKAADDNYKALINCNHAPVTTAGEWSADKLFKLLRDKGVKTITKEELAKKLTKIVAFKADVSTFLTNISALEYVKANNKYTVPAAGEKFDEVMKKNMGSEYEKYFSAFNTDAFDGMNKNETHGISDLFKKLKSLNIPSLTYDNVKEKVKTNSTTEIGKTLVSTLMNVDDDFSPFKPSEITDLCERLSADMQKTDGDKTMCQVYSENQTNKAAYLALKKDSAEKHKQFTKTNLNLLINLQTLKSQMKKNKENTYQQYAKYGKDDLLKFMFGFVLTPSETGGPIEYSKNIGKFSDKLQIKAVKKDYITQISEPEKIDDKKTLKFKAGGIYPVFLHNIEPEFITTCARQFGITNSLGYIFYTKKSFDNDYWIYKMQNGHSYHSNKKDEFMQFVGGEDLIVVMEALQDFEITIDSSESKKKIAQLTKTLTEKGSYEQPTQLNPVPAVSTESTDSTVSANTGPGNAKSVGGGGNSKYKVTKRKKSKNQKIKMPSQKRQ